MRRFFRWCGKWIVKAFTAIDRDHIFVYAGQASLLIIIATLPFIMLLISLAQYILPMDKEVIAATGAVFLPESLTGYFQALLDELFSKSTLPIVSVTAVAALWSASRGLNAVKCGLRSLYRLRPRRGPIGDTLMSIVYTLLFLFLLLGTLAVLVFGNSLQSLLEAKWPAVGRVTEVLVRFRSLYAAAGLTFAFMVMYRVLPGGRLPFWRQFPGAAVAAVGWMAFSFVYSIYIDNFANYSYIYGSLTAVVLLMVWLYTCMAMLLMGAEFNVFLLNNFWGKAKEKPASRLGPDEVAAAQAVIAQAEQEQAALSRWKQRLRRHGAHAKKRGTGDAGAPAASPRAPAETRPETRLEGRAPEDRNSRKDG